MDLGRQHTHTGIRSLPTEVREAIFHFGQQRRQGSKNISRVSHRGDQTGKWLKMAEKSSPRLFGRKWISRALYAIPLLLAVAVSKQQIA